jgi:hypothetical protein
VELGEGNSQKISGGKVMGKDIGKLKKEVAFFKKENIALKKEIVTHKDNARFFEDEMGRILDKIDVLRDEIKRKDELLSAIKLLIEYYHVWTGQRWQQEHVPDFVATKIVRMISEEQAMKEVG